MPYPFYCPNGHALQAELTAIGQVAQCPACGASFLVPPPDFGALTTRNAEGLPGHWVAGGEANLPVAIAVEPPPTSEIPARTSSGPQAASSETPAPPAPAPPAGPSAAELPQPAYGRPTDAIFADYARAQAAKEAQRAPRRISLKNRLATGARLNPPTAPSPAAGTPALAISVSDAPAPSIPAEETAAVEPSASLLADTARVDVLLGAAAPSSASPDSRLTEAPSPAAPQPAATVDQVDSLADAAAVQPEQPELPLPKTLRVRCPSGHILKAPSELLGRPVRCPTCKKSFALRYENSLEFQRRAASLYPGHQNQTGRKWVAWAFAAVFAVFLAVAAVVLLRRQ